MDVRRTIGKPATLNSSTRNQRCLSIKELSAHTGLSESTIRRRVKDGTLPFIQPGGPRTRVVFPADIQERLLSSAEPTTKSTEGQPSIDSSPPAKRGPRPKWFGALINPQQSIN
jgi:excisionase family DNA binding protein